MADEPLSPDQIRGLLREACQVAENGGHAGKINNLIRLLCDDHETLTRAAQQLDGNKETGCLCPDCVSERMGIRANAYGVLTVLVFDENRDALVCFQHNTEHTARILDVTRTAVVATLEAVADALSGAAQQETKH